MSDNNDWLQMILNNILRKYESTGKNLSDSALIEEEQGIVSKSAVVLLETLKSEATAKLRASKDIENEFEAAVLKTWSKPLALLDLLLYICLEVGSEFSSGRGNICSSKHSYVQEVLAKQQGNACLVFNEIIHLLKSGFPSGAHLHWRTLHEIVCLSYFISKHGEELAKRFLDYKEVESYFQAEAIYEHQQTMACTCLSESDFKRLEKDFKKIEKIYGADFVKKSNYPYGWVPRAVLKTRSLKEIEKSVKLDALRPYYDLAGYNVQGSQNGLIFKLGTMKNTKNPMTIPIGPSNYGLADPGKSAAISLGQVTACLLLAESDVKKLIIVEALRNLVDEICDAFCEIQAEFKD